MKRRIIGILTQALLVAAGAGGLCSPLSGQVQGDMPLEGFLPLVGIGLTNEFQDSTDISSSTTFFIAQPSNRPGGQPLGVGSSAFYDLALFDTGAATHILTPDAHVGFDIDREGFDGTNTQPIGGATGIIELSINDPLGVYAGPLSGRTVSGTQLRMNTSTMRGQTSFATLSAPDGWSLPNIIGLPMAAQHKVTIRNDQPQIFQFQGRTVRSPDIRLGALGTGESNIVRRSPLKIKPGIGFVQGPLYVQNLDFTTLVLHENPLSPSVIENGGLYIEADFARGDYRLEDTEFLFDTGASMTVVSEQTAVRLGFDPILDTPDFVLQVEGSGGVGGNVPGFYVDQFRLDTIGGSFVLDNVPVAVLDVTSPNDPGNIVDGILGMNVFANRNLTIDAIPQVGQGGVSPSLYISDPITQSHAWGTTSATADWLTAGNWSAAGVPGVLWDAKVANVRGSDQRAVLSQNSTVYRATISGASQATMTVEVAPNAVLTTYGDLVVQPGGQLHLDHGRIDAQFVDIHGGMLTGEGSIFVGSGPLTGVVRNTGGRIAPGDAAQRIAGRLEITGDLSNDSNGTLAFDLGGNVAGTEYDQIFTDRFAFLSGTLELSLADLGSGLFDPRVGDSFVLIQTNEGRRGTFDNLILPTNYEWDVRYNPFDVTVQVLGLAALTGDLNGDGVLDCLDANLLTAATSSGSAGLVYDLNEDGHVDTQDIEYWVTHEKGTLPGDANLDGVVDGIDLSVWQSHRFTVENAWCRGDFNGDGHVDGADFAIWNAHKFQSAAGLASVPEPRAWLLCGLALSLWGVRWRRAVR